VNQLAHQLFGEPAVRGVLRGGEQPSVFGADGDAGIHSGFAAIPPRTLDHRGIGLDQRHIGRQEPQLGDLCM
jgi:hypothetical protein